jgi:hypothetical protein
VSFEGFLIRFLLGLLGSLAAISFVVGYVMPSRDAQGQVLAVMLHSRALEPTGSCTSDLTTQVGSPPTSRLEPSFETFRRACTHFQRFHVAITLAIDQGHDSEIGKALEEEKQAAGLLL